MARRFDSKCLAAGCHNLRLPRPARLSLRCGVLQLARNCAYDFAKYGIRSNSVCAGTIETPISKEERAAHGWCECVVASRRTPAAA